MALSRTSTEGKSAPAGTVAAPGRWNGAGAVTGLDEVMALLAAVAGRLATATPDEIAALTCSGFARLLGIDRCSVWSEERDGTMALRQSQLAPTVDPSAVADLASPEALARWLEDGWAAGGAMTRSWQGRVDTAGGGGRDVSLLVVPIGDRATFLLEGDAGWRCPPAHVDLVRVVAALGRQHSLDARRAREERQQAAVTDALHRLLKTGVRARSPIEAATALASTAAEVLDFPVACAYLVDEGGIISEAVTVGTDDEHARRLRQHLIGKVARESPVWRRTVEGPHAGPDLVDDTSRAGVVRRQGVAQSLGLRSMAAIPLLSSDGPLGLVLCGDHVPRRRWRVGDRELLAQLSLEGAVVVDNARLRASERFEATHDSLTGLLNRRAFAALLREAVAQVAGAGEPVAALLLDLDRFKEVNDHLGHHRGDELLKAVAGRLRRCVRPTDVLARLGGDEFAVLLRQPGTQERAEVVAAQISALFDQPFEIDECVLHVDASIGIACSPLHTGEMDGLLQRADVAMYRAKRSGRDAVVYDPESMAHSALAPGLLGELRRALDRGEQLRLYYQPKIDLRTGAVTSVEALVRWDHPTHGVLGPDRFVPMAEETGLIRALTNWVAPEALRQLCRWDADAVPLRVSVNVSARDIADPDFVARVTSWLEQSGVDGSRLIVEVTEGSLLADRPEASAVLTRLHRLGVQASLDDFGTGYSSLAYLETLPVDEVKIDRQFLHLGRSKGSVIRSIVSLAHELGMTVVVEGVETAEQAAWLSETGCDEAQGYHFAAPLDADALARWVRLRHAGVAPVPPPAVAGGGTAPPAGR